METRFVGIICISEILIVQNKTKLDNEPSIKIQLKKDTVTK